MPDEKNKIYLLEVQNCPMESDVPADVKFEHKNSMRKAFGDDFKVVKCEAVKNGQDKTIFCEMVIRSTKANRELCPPGTKVVMVFEDDVL